MLSRFEYISSLHLHREFDLTHIIILSIQSSASAIFPLTHNIAFSGKNQLGLCLYSFLSILTLFQSCNNLLRVSDGTSFTQRLYDHAMFISPGIVNIKNKCIDVGSSGVLVGNTLWVMQIQRPCTCFWLGFCMYSHTSFIMQNSSRCSIKRWLIIRRAHCMARQVGFFFLSLFICVLDKSYFCVLSFFISFPFHCTSCIYPSPPLTVFFFYY